MTDLDVLKKAIKVYGTKKQVDMAIEEMSILTKELLKYRRNDDSETQLNIQEKIVDAYIMLSQLEMMFSSRTVSAYYTQRKLARLEKQLEGENEEDE